MPKDKSRILFLAAMRERVTRCQERLEAGMSPLPILKELDKIEVMLAVQYGRNPRATTIWSTGNGKKSHRSKIAKQRENMRRMQFGKTSSHFTEAT